MLTTYKARFFRQQFLHHKNRVNLPRHGVNYFYAENFTLADDPLQVKVQSVYTPDGDTLVTGRFSNSSYTYNKDGLGSTW